MSNIPNSYELQANICNERKWKSFQVGAIVLLTGVLGGAIITTLGAVFGSWAVFYGGCGLWFSSTVVAAGAAGVCIYYDCKEDFLREKDVDERKKNVNKPKEVNTDQNYPPPSEQKKPQSSKEQLANIVMNWAQSPP